VGPDLCFDAQSSDKGIARQQGRLALDLANTALGFAEINPKVATLVFNMFQLAKKNGAQYLLVFREVTILRYHLTIAQEASRFI